MLAQNVIPCTPQLQEIYLQSIHLPLNASDISVIRESASDVEGSEVGETSVICCYSFWEPTDRSEYTNAVRIGLY